MTMDFGEGLCSILMVWGIGMAVGLGLSGLVSGWTANPLGSEFMAGLGLGVCFIGASHLVRSNA